MGCRELKAGPPLQVIAKESSTPTHEGVLSTCPRPGMPAAGDPTRKHTRGSAWGQSRARAEARAPGALSRSLRAGFTAIVVAWLLPLAATAPWAREGGVSGGAAGRGEAPGIAWGRQQRLSPAHTGRRLAGLLGLPRSRVHRRERRGAGGAASGGQGGSGEGSGGPLLSPEDEELFAAALATRHAGGTPRIAFLFLVRGPLPLAPLWARFFEGHEDQFSIYIHTDEGFQYRDEDVPAVFRGRQIPSKAMRWGAVSMLDAQRRLLASALRDARNTHFVLLCKGSVPLLDFPTTFDFITRAPHSFLYANMSSHRSWTPRFLPQIPREDWRRGSPWFVLQRRHAALVVGERAYYAKFREVGLPNGNEELYAHTLLTKLDGRRLMGASLMYAHWRHAQHQAPLPRLCRIYQGREVTLHLLSFALGHRCAADGYRFWRCRLFGRRFAPDALQPLMALLPLKMPVKAVEQGGGERPAETVEHRGRHSDGRERAQGNGGGDEGEESAGRATGGTGRKAPGGARQVQIGAEDGEGQTGPSTWKGKNVTGGPLLCPEDEALFADALAMAPASGRPPRIAFLFLVRGPLPLARLWEKFFLGQNADLYSIYIHASTPSSADEAQLPEVLQGRRVFSKPTKYGTVTVVDGERRLLANALLNPGNTHFALVCESTAPLFDFPFIYQHLTSVPRSLLVNYDSHGLRWTKEFLPLIPKSDWGKGAAWFSLQRRHARMVVADRAYYSYFKAIRMRGDSYDEHYYQTLLYKKDPRGLIRRTPMAIHWQVGPHFRKVTTHPDKFEPWRIGPGLIADLAGPHCAPGDPQRFRCHVFARKFSPAALEPLLQLLPMPRVPTRGEVVRMAQQYWSPQRVELPQGGVPGAGRAAGSYLEAWRGQVEEDKKGRGGGVAARVPSPLLSQEEEELFGKALAVEPAGAPRVAFLFLVRDKFLLAPLWAKFFRGRQKDFSLYVYTEERHIPTPFPRVFRAATFVEGASSNRGIMEGTRRLLATALLDPRNSHFLLMCEATVPLFNFTFAFSYITQTPYSFVDSSPGVARHWQPALEALFPRADWRVGEPWGAMLQRPHAAMVVADTAYYRVLNQAGVKDSFGERSYLATLLGRQDPGSFFSRSLAHACWPTLDPSTRDPTMSPVTFYYWDAGRGFIRDMASPRCPYIPSTGTPSVSNWGQSKQPCFLFMRKLHGDALDALQRVLPVSVTL